MDEHENIDLELDFDLADFDTVDGDDGSEPDPFYQRPEMTRILKPKIDIRSVTHKVRYSNAAEFVHELDLSEGARTFAWVAGDFIFGDIIEALIAERNAWPKKIYICSLSISEDNIDMLHNILEFCPEIERVVLCLSAYFYSHEKYSLVKYLYEQLDFGDDRVQVVFATTHTKLIAMETVHGHYLTIHGSANLRSSNSVEQFMAEQGKDLYDFNAAIIEELAERFGTINYGVPRDRFRRLDWKKTWSAVRRPKGDTF